MHILVEKKLPDHVPLDETAVCIHASFSSGFC